MTPRRADAADAPVLAALHAGAFDAPWSPAVLATLLAAPGAFALLAQAAGEPTGFVLCRTAADEAEVITLAVVPSHRRRGVGRALIGAATDLARAMGARVLFLEVAADNAPALALYEGEDFAAAGRREAYYARPSGAVDAVVLRRPLNR